MTIPTTEYVNEVRLVGRVSSAPRQHVLPSGDPLVTVRVSVPRPPGPRHGRPRARADTVVCVAWTSRGRARLARLRKDDLVLVEGALRRRLWRSAHGPVSRIEVEAGRVRRVRRPARDPPRGVDPRACV